MIDFPELKSSRLLWNKKIVSTGPMIRIVQDENGFSYVTCECMTFGRKSWCGHVGLVHQDNAWEPNETFKEWAPCIMAFVNPGFLLIPTLVLPQEEPDLNRVDVLWGNPQQKNGEYKAEGGETLGFIRNSQGRHAIRRLIIEWLPSLMYRSPPLFCDSNTHTSGDSMTDYITDLEPLEDKEKRRLYRDLFSILDSGDCARCIEDSRIAF